MSISLTRLQSSTAFTNHPAWPSWMPRLSFAPYQADPQGDILVIIFLRGGADALNIIVPFGEDAYYTRRPTLGIARPDDNRSKIDQRAIDLDGFFGMHPVLAPLQDAWQAGHLAIVHACGSPDESRSHFKAMEIMERGVGDELGPGSGWVGRHLATLDTQNTSPLQAIGLGELPQRSLRGGVPISAFRSISDFHFNTDPKITASLRSAIASLYTGDDPLSVAGQETLALQETLNALDPHRYQAANELPYPDTEYGLGLKQIAMLIKAQVGLEVAAIDLGGWDTHFAQGSSEGLMANLIADLGAGLAAFHADMVDHLKRLIIVVMSEFGRRASENGSLGTDHGHGGFMMLLGGHVAGGKVHTEWPGLADRQLVEPGDLAITIDYRDVLSEVCLKRLNNPSIAEVFPGFTPTIHDLLCT